MHIYGNFEGFPLKIRALCEWVIYIMTPCNAVDGSEILH